MTLLEFLQVLVEEIFEIMKEGRSSEIGRFRSGMRYEGLLFNEEASVFKKHIGIGIAGDEHLVFTVAKLCFA
jgi:hypothetical protein